MKSVSNNSMFTSWSALLNSLTQDVHGHGQQLGESCSYGKWDRKCTKIGKSPINNPPSGTPPPSSFGSRPSGTPLPPPPTNTSTSGTYPPPANTYSATKYPPGPLSPPATKYPPGPLSPPTNTSTSGPLPASTSSNQGNSSSTGYPLGQFSNNQSTNPSLPQNRSTLNSQDDETNNQDNWATPYAKTYYQPQQPQQQQQQFPLTQQQQQQLPPPLTPQQELDAAKEKLLDYNPNLKNRPVDPNPALVRGYYNLYTDILNNTEFRPEVGNNREAFAYELVGKYLYTRGNMKGPGVEILKDAINKRLQNSDTDVVYFYNEILGNN